MPQPAPDSIALVLAAHGDRAGETRNRALFRHRDVLRGEALFRCVTAGTLKGEPPLEKALEEASRSGAGRILVYPMFMADGYFASRVLPRRIEEAGLALPTHLLRPLGLDNALPPLLLERARARAAEAGLPPGETELVLVGHGSESDRASARATHAAAAHLHRFETFRAVTVALIEEPPSLCDVLAATERPKIVVGFFSGDGLHAGEDVGAALREARSTAIYAGAAGALPEVAGLIRSAALAWRGGGEAEPDLSG